MYQPIPKIESKSQCTGEAEYVGDIPDFNNLVHCALVTAEKGVGELDNVDPSEALVIYLFAKQRIWRITNYFVVSSDLCFQNLNGV